MGYILLILILVIIVFWPWIREWIRRYSERRMEDMVRRMMGMPTRKEEERRRKAEAKAQKRGNTRRPATSARAKSTTDLAEQMKSVAVDVEYTEIKEFESTTVAEETPEGTRVYHEEQVSDVEFVEIKESDNKSSK